MLTLNFKVPKKFNSISLSEPIKDSIAIYTNKLRNQVVTNTPFKSWTLRRSIQSDISNNWMKAEIWTNIVYAPIQEFGWIIRPKTKPYLTFKIDGKWIRTKKSVIKWKEYFQKAMKKFNEASFNKILVNELKSYLNKLK